MLCPVSTFKFSPFAPKYFRKYFLWKIFHRKYLYSDCRYGKTTAIRLIAVRETGVSRHHGGSFEGPPETPRTSEYYRIEGFKWGPLIGPPLCRETPVSRTANVGFFQSGQIVIFSSDVSERLRALWPGRRSTLKATLFFYWQLVFFEKIYYLVHLAWDPPTIATNHFTFGTFWL